MRWIIALGALALLSLACSTAAGQEGPTPEPRDRAETQPTPEGERQSTPITSAGDPSDPVPFRWTTHETHEPGGRLVLRGGTLHAIPSRVRLLDPNGQVLAEADAVQVRDAQGACPGGPGLAQAELTLADEPFALFTGDWPDGYRLEVLVGSTWRPTALTFAGCRITE